MECFIAENVNEVDSFDLGLQKFASQGVQDTYDTALIHSDSRVLLCAVRGPMSIRLTYFNSCKGNKSLWSWQ